MVVQGSPKTLRIAKTAAELAMKKEQRLPVLKDKGANIIHFKIKIIHAIESYFIVYKNVKPRL